jgi:hypothetical protein
MSAVSSNFRGAVFMACNRGTVRAGSQAEGPAAERLSSVNDVTELRIEFEISGETNMRS